jgi:PilZ domain-containing protein
MANRRKSYRVAEQSSFEGLSIAVLKGSDAFVASIVNISRGGAAIVLDQHFDFKSPSDGVLHLRFHSHWLKKPIYVLGDIRSWSEVDGGSLHRVKFSDFLDLLSQLPADLRRVFNKRTTPRFEAGGALPINVNLDIHACRIPALLKDLTPDGISVTIKKKLAAIRFEARHVEASFRLPEVNCAFEFSGTVVHSRPCDAGLCWGIRFDGKSRDFRAKQDHLLQFIGRRGDPSSGRLRI